jgi:Mg-chelatase subunit ChlD
MNSEVAFGCVQLAVDGPPVAANTPFAPRIVAAKHDGEDWLAFGFASGFDGAGMSAGRIPLKLALVVDISGSMGGTLSCDNEAAVSKISVCKSSIKSIMHQLLPSDQLSITLFNHNQQLILPLTQVSQLDIRQVELTIDQLASGGGTRLAEGFAAGLATLPSGAQSKKAVSRLMFLTDMQSSAVDEAQVLQLIRDSAARSLFTTVVGVGVDLSVGSVQQISSTVGARYISVAEPEEFATRLTTEFAHDSIPIATQIQFSIANATIQTAYGHPELAGLRGGVSQFTLASEFASPEPNNTGLLLLKLQPTVANISQYNTSVSWKTLDGKQHTAALNCRANQPPTASIRKAVALIRWVEVLDSYVMDDSTEGPEQRATSSQSWIAQFEKLKVNLSSEFALSGDTTLETTNASFIQTTNQMINTEQAELQAALAQTTQANTHQDVSDDVDAPEDFKCCITKALMFDPVIASDGHSYDRAAITTWLQHKVISPKTNLPLTSKKLIPNRALKSAINSFLTSQTPRLSTASGIHSSDVTSNRPRYRSKVHRARQPNRCNLKAKPTRHTQSQSTTRNGRKYSI